MFWNQYCLVRLAVVHRGRALPVTWRVLARPSATVKFADYQELLNQAVERLPKQVKVVLLGDRGFGSTELMGWVTRQAGWHYRLRVKRDLWVWRAGRGWCQLQNFHFQMGEVRCFHNVKLHKSQWYGPVHLCFGRNNVNGEFWAVVSDELTNLQTFREYGYRFDIEEAFRDDQSGAWNFQKSAIRSRCALSRLWFLLAVATLYLTAQGVAVLATGRRRWVDPHWFRGNSYLRIGWDWVRAAVLNGWQLLERVVFTGCRDPEPAMASRRQHERRTYQLEFSVQTYRYAAD